MSTNSGQIPAQNIIDAEKIRINEKGQSFQNIQFGKQRALDLNKNFEDRTTAFNRIFIVIFSTLALIILLIFLKKTVYGIEGFINIAIFLISFLGFGYSMFLWIDFSQRDPSDFNKIMYVPPGALSADQVASNASMNGGGIPTNSGIGESSGNGGVDATGQSFPPGSENQSFQMVNVFGQLIDSNGVAITNQNLTRNSQGQLVNMFGQLVNSQGQFVNSQGQLVNNKGQRINAQGYLIDENGNELPNQPEIQNGLPVVGPDGHYINHTTGESMPDTPPPPTLPTIIPVIPPNGPPPILDPVTLNPIPPSPPDKPISVTNQGPGKPIKYSSGIVPIIYTTPKSTTTTTTSAPITPETNTTTPRSSNQAQETDDEGNPIPSDEVLSTIFNNDPMSDLHLSSYNVPKLITNEIFLASNNRDTILVKDLKTFYFFNLNLSKDTFKSYDGIHFIDIENKAILAQVVIDGPKSSYGATIDGKGIVVLKMNENAKEYYYFYPSKYPATLHADDIFLGPNGTSTIQVIDKNSFKLQTVVDKDSINSNTINVLRSYTSTDGYLFIDNKNDLNQAKIVMEGPKEKSLDKTIYGQAILLYNKDTGENSYYYYDRNLTEKEQKSIADYTYYLTTPSSTTYPSTYSSAATSLLPIATTYPSSISLLPIATTYSSNNPTTPYSVTSPSDYLTTPVSTRIPMSETQTTPSFNTTSLVPYSTTTPVQYSTTLPSTTPTTTKKTTTKKTTTKKTTTTTPTTTKITTTPTTTKITTTPYSSSTTPYISSTTPYRSSTTPYISSTTPYRSSTTPYMSSTTPYRSSTTPYISSTTPYISSTTPYRSSTTPYSSSTTPYSSSTTPYSSSTTFTTTISPTTLITTTLSPTTTTTTTTTAKPLLFPSLIVYYPFVTDLKNYVYDKINGIQDTDSVGGANVKISDTGSGSLVLDANKQQHLKMNSNSPIVASSFIGNNGMSFACWINYTTFNKKPNSRIFDFGSGGSGADSRDNIMMYINASDSIGCAVYFDSSNKKSALEHTNTVNGGWHHVIFTMTYASDKNSTWTIYLDGRIVQTSSSNYYPRQVARENSYLGRSFNSNIDPYFDGKIDDFRIYQRVLTEDDVSQIYQSTDEVIKYFGFRINTQNSNRTTTVAPTSTTTTTVAPTSTTTTTLPPTSTTTTTLPPTSTTTTTLPPTSTTTTTLPPTSTTTTTLPPTSTTTTTLPPTSTTTTTLPPTSTTTTTLPPTSTTTTTTTTSTTTTKAPISTTMSFLSRNDLVLYYPFKENIKNYSMDKNNGREDIYMSGRNSMPYIFNNSLLFIDKHYHHLYTYGLDNPITNPAFFPSNTAVSFCCWFTNNNSANGAPLFDFSCFNSPNGTYYNNIGMRFIDDGIECYVYGNKSYPYNSGWDSQNFPNVSALFYKPEQSINNSPHFFVWTMLKGQNESSVWKIYIDNKLVKISDKDTNYSYPKALTNSGYNTNYIGTNMFNQAFNKTLGLFRTGQGQNIGKIGSYLYFNGSINNFCVFNRELSVQDINIMYNSTKN